MAGGGKNKLELIKQGTPKFLRDFKARVGYKEGPTVDTKRRDIPKDHHVDDDNDDGVEKEDEQPTICVLKEGDITEEEYKFYRAENGLDSKGKASSDGDIESTKDASCNERVIFKAPSKRRKEQISEHKATKDAKQRKKTSSKMKKVDNKSLLSFADDYD